MGHEQRRTLGDRELRRLLGVRADRLDLVAAPGGHDAAGPGQFAGQGSIRTGPTEAFFQTI